MPTYEYECNKCGKKKDEFHTMQKVPESIKCKCDGKMKRLIGTGTGHMFTDWFSKNKDGKPRITKNNN